MRRSDQGPPAGAQQERMVRYKGKGKDRLAPVASSGGKAPNGEGQGVSVAPSPEAVYDRAREEGRRRLSMPLLEQVATGFIAGVTIVFGIVALGVTEALVAPDLGGGVAVVASALAFSIGVVFLVVGRSELFSENFFDPVAAAINESGGRVWGRLARLWVTILALNLVGGAVMVALLTVKGALPEEANSSLIHVAEEIAAKSWQATVARAVLAGALITLLSYMLSACNSVASRILVTAMVGFFLAIGPFDHVVVSVLHLLFGLWESNKIHWADLGQNLALSTGGNLAGGLLLITLTHSAQVKAAQ
jgi:formate/nitrite transporter FocA (FNT family)